MRLRAPRAPLWPARAAGPGTTAREAGGLVPAPPESSRWPRRAFLLRAAAAAGAAAAAVPAVRRAFAACASIGQHPGIGADFPGGLETRSGVNIGYYPFRVCSPEGGTWLYSGDWGPGLGGKRLAFLPNGVEVSLTSVPNVGACTGGGNCASDSPPLRTSAKGSEWNWGYAERFPADGLGSVAAPTQDQGWVNAKHLLFVGYTAHTRRLGPACRDFEVHTNPTDGKPIAANGLPNTNPKDTCLGPSPACNGVNACNEGEGDCQSDFGDTDNYGEGSKLSTTCLGGYEYSPYVADDNSPDMPKGSAMPLSYLFYAPRSNTKCYLHAGDVCRVLWRRTMWIQHASGPNTKASWYGVEILQSSCPFLSPPGVRGWVMAFSEWDQQQSGRGQFFTTAA